MRIINKAPAAGSVSANVTTAQVFPTALDATAPCVLTVPGTSRMNGKKFMVRASGGVVTGTTTNVTVSLYAKVAVPATPLTASNWTLIKASTARAVNTAKCPWYIEADLIADQDSGILDGLAGFMVGGSIDAKADITNTITSVDLTVEPAVCFVAVVTFSSADVGNVAKLLEFSLGF